MVIASAPRRWRPLKELVWAGSRPRITAGSSTSSTCRRRPTGLVPFEREIHVGDLLSAAKFQVDELELVCVYIYILV